MIDEVVQRRIIADCRKHFFNLANGIFCQCLIVDDSPWLIKLCGGSLFY